MAGASESFQDSFVVAPSVLQNGINYHTVRDHSPSASCNYEGLEIWGPGQNWWCTEIGTLYRYLCDEVCTGIYRTRSRKHRNLCPATLASAVAVPVLWPAQSAQSPTRLTPPSPAAPLCHHTLYPQHSPPNLPGPPLSKLHLTQHMPRK